MKGIILAGGHGTRLHPMTKAVSKHLLPIYNKPMIFYPLASLMLAGIRDFLVITKTDDQPLYRRLLGKGEDFGVNISYAIQDEPAGIAQAVTIGAEFTGGDTFSLVLGDNIFFGAGLGTRIEQALKHNDGATVFAYHVANPRAYGVVTLDDQGKPVTIEEKPANPQSNWAVTGMYVYGPDAASMVRGMKPSARGELEITDLNRLYLEQGRLNVELFGRGYAWLDMGTPQNLLDAADFVRTIEERQGLQVCNPLEIAETHGWI